MSDHQKFAKQEPVFTALMTIALKLETMDQRMEKGFDGVKSRLDTLENGQSKLFSMMEKLLEGQAVLHQNDMEIKRRLDAKHD